MNVARRVGMMNIIEKYSDYAYNSFRYIDEEDIEAGQPGDIYEDDECFFMFIEKGSQIRIYWAAKSDKAFFTGMQGILGIIGCHECQKNRIYIGFLPLEFVAGMESLGFKVVHEWMDYWIDDLSKLEISKELKHNVRVLEKHEYQRAAEVTQLCRGYSREFFGEEEGWVEEWMESSNSQAFVVEIDGCIQGICFMGLYGFDNPKGTVAWVRELAVNPRYHSRGIGRSLIIKGLMWGIENGAKRSFLAVDIENHNAIALYENIGYKRREEHGEIGMALKV
jgi:GNAT superfamily N-acetyltransferase